MWMQRSRLPGRQRGSIILPAAAALIVCMILLASANLGYLFYVKRELQNAADLAALSGVQYIHSAEGDASTSCTTAQVQARLAMQGFFDDKEIIKLSDADVKFVCGTWNVAYAAPEHFAEQTGTHGSYNALKVVIDRKNILPLMPFASAAEAHASAIAKSAIPVAAFQIESQLLRFNGDSALGGLLSIVGLSLEDLRLLDSDGLASAKISPSGLLGLLGVDLGVGGLGVLTPDGVANIDNLTLLNILDASISAVNDNVLRLDLQAIKKKLLGVTIGAIDLLDVVIPLGGTADDPGLFAFLGIGRHDPLDGALDVQLGVGDLIKTAIGIGVQGHALDTKVDLLGVKVKAIVVEPPTIVIGPVGAKGYGSQVRLFIDVDTDNLPILGLLTKLLNIRVHLPVALDLVAADGELRDISCGVPNTIDVAVKSRILNACVGKFDDNSLLSHSAACEVGLQEDALIKLIFPTPLLSGKLHVEGLSYCDPKTYCYDPLTTDIGSAYGLKVGEMKSTRPNELLLGDTVENLVVGLLNLLGGLFREPEAPFDNHKWDWEGVTGNQFDRIVTLYLEEANVGGLYKVGPTVDLMRKGRGVEGDADYLPPLIDSDFITNQKLVCLPLVDLICWKSKGSFKETLSSYVEYPSGLTSALGLSVYGSCAGLLKVVGVFENYNECFKRTVKDIFSANDQHVYASLNGYAPPGLLDPKADGVDCNGLLCVILKPVIGILKPILNGVGGQLAGLLNNALGLELGRTDIKALDIQCEPARLVY